MIDTGSAFPWTDVLAQNLRAYPQAPFLIEQVALWQNASYSLRYVNDREEYPHDFVTTFASLPVPNGTDEPWNTGTIGGWMAINQQTEHADAAWELLKFWLAEGAIHMLKGGKIPSFPGTDQQAVVEGLLGPDRDTLYDVAAFEAAVFDPTIKLVTDTIATGAAEISQIVQGNSDLYLIGEISLEEWVAETKSQADEAIARATA